MCSSDLLGPVDTRTGGAFELGIVTRYLAAGRHVAEIFCTDPVARLSRTVFWVAAPQTSSNLFFVILVSLFMVGAIGWVALGTFASAALGKAPARP